MIGYGTPQSNDSKSQDTLIYILRTPTAKPTKNWKELHEDSEWIKVRGDSEENGPLAKKIDSSR